MVPCNFVTIVTSIVKVTKELTLQMKQKHKNPTTPKRIAEYNVKRLTSLAGKLQMESGDEKSLDDAIDCLFDCKEQLELIKKKEKENEG